MLDKATPGLAFHPTGDASTGPCLGQPFLSMEMLVEALPGLETTYIYGQHFVVFEVFHTYSLLQSSQEHQW